MSQDNVNSGAARTSDAEPETGQPEDEQPTEDTGVTGEAEGADADLQAARDEIARLKDQYVRTRAELDNVRKRAERDVDSARKFGIEKFAAELLGVRDSLEAGLAVAQEPQTDLAKMREGMELTDRMLGQAMEKFGVEPLDPQGETFNPEYHEAMSTQETAESAPNTVVNVVQKGYLLNGRVLRPAMVIVSRAPEADSRA